MTPHRLALVAGMALLVFSHAPLAAEDTGDVAAGRRLATRHCGQCHAIGSGVSLLRDAPSFSDLHKRYRAGGLPQLLREGMLQPSSLPEEGSLRRHTRMPMAVLEDDELRELTAYLRSLEPAPVPKPASR